MNPVFLLVVFLLVASGPDQTVESSIPAKLEKTFLDRNKVSEAEDLPMVTGMCCVFPCYT